MRLGTLQINKGTLETAWWGPGPAEAPTLVLLHEGLGSVALWRDIPERLAASTGCGVFAYSRFGYGYSDPTPLPRPMSYMHHEAQAVLPEVLLAAGIGRNVLIGHSDGGSIAAIYAGSEATPNPLGPELLGIVTIAAHFFVEDLNIASIHRIKTDYETGPIRQRMARYHRDVDTAFRGWNDAWLDPRFRGFDIIGLLANIRVPVLGLQGANDPYGTDSKSMCCKRTSRAPIETLLIPGAQHSPHLEAKDATLAAMTGFIANLTRNFLT